MRADRGVFTSGRLKDRERCHGAVVIALNFGAERVDTGRLEPQLAPRAKIATARGLELVEKVVEGRVLPLVFLEVRAKALEEGVLAHVGNELTQNRGALGVGDAVEVRLHGIEVHHVGNDRVRGRQLVLAVGPGLLGAREGRPRIRPARGSRRGKSRGELGERFVEPQVIPPLHGHEVTEPHVGELVENSEVAAFANRVGDSTAENVALNEGHRTRVLHCAHVVFGHEDLVVGRERVVVIEKVFVELEALLRD